MFPPGGPYQTLKKKKQNTNHLHFAQYYLQKNAQL